MDNLQRLIAIFNCAMEHVPENSRKVFAQLAQTEVQALEQQLNQQAKLATTFIDTRPPTA